MKKPYVKPQILFESFALSTSIAGDCEVKSNNAVRDQCPYKAFRLGIMVFTTLISGCDYTEENDHVVAEPDGTFSYNGVCYHVPLETNNLFNS